MNKKPKHFAILKIIGFIGVGTAIVGTVLSSIGFGDFETNNFMLGGILSIIGFMMAGVGLMIGFIPEFAKFTTKTTKYIQEENKDDLTDIMNNSAEITSEAITTTTKAIKQGFVDTKFCKYCGAEIDADSVFCNKCGKEQ